MLSMLNRFMALPKPLQGGLLLLSGGGLVAAMYFLLPGRWLFLFIMGMLIMAMLLVTYRSMRRRRRKRKAAKLEKGISDHSASTAPAAAEPAARARLDDMRTQFENGIAKFRAVGKNLYQLPWYVLVGESGSGKTEAMRHCNIGFPPGLQDRLQGVGGTINMHWWFTDNAVILDTAGRMMFEEAAGTEWKEFLKLIVRHRPNCPINGMLLVIPVDSLIRDTAEEIERKGSRIAQQFDMIQRELGVRFPVFVVITKCDRLIGFKEFFDSLTDPELQHQMLGWSNPAPLDDAFNPERVGEFIDTIVGRLIRRRLRLLLEPVHAGDRDARRADQVDALYSFPQSLDRIGPRLQRYLQMVFTAGTWSARPLFLRGIYLTSSMREGSALDEELAEMLGVPVESLPEGRVWAEDRAYFLRDLFVSKIFKERGLVTRATNARRSQRRRRAVVLAAGFLSVAILFVCSWLAARSLERSIGRHRDYWQAVAGDKNWKDRDYWNPVVEAETKRGANFSYRGDKKVDVAGKSVALVQLYPELRELTGQDIHIPWAFRFAAALGESVNEDRRAAYRKIFLASVLRPVVDAARRKMRTGEPWSAAQTRALVQLLRIEAATVEPADEVALDLRPLIDCVLPPGDEAPLSGDEAETLQKCLDWTLANGDADWPWLCEALKAGSEGARESIFTGSDDARGGVDRFIAHWSDPKEHGGQDVQAMFRLRDLFASLHGDLQNYAKAEAALLKIVGPGADTPTRLAEYTQAAEQWRTSLFAETTKQKAAVDARLAELKLAVVKAELGVDFTNDQWVVLAYRLAAENITASAADAFAALLGHLPARGGEAPRQAWWDSIRVAVETAEEALAKRLEKTGVPLDELGTLNAQLLATVTVEPQLRAALAGLVDRGQVGEPVLAGDSWRLYEARFAVYAMVDAQLNADDPVPAPADVPKAIADLKADLTRTLDVANGLWQAHGAAELPADADVLTMPKFIAFALGRLAPRGRVHALLQGVVAWPPERSPQAEDIATQVTKAGGDAAPAALPRIPLTRLAAGEHAFPARYRPAAARRVLLGFQSVGQYLTPPVEGQPHAIGFVLERDSLHRLHQGWLAARQGYMRDYLTYWAAEVGKNLAIEAARPDWPTYRGQLTDLKVKIRTVRADLEKLTTAILSALNEVKPLAAEMNVDVEIRRAADSLAALKEKNWEDNTRRVLDKWIELTGDSKAARVAILALKPSDFLLDCIPPSPEGPAQVAETYLRAATVRALELIARDAEDTARKALRQLKAEYLHFPMTTPAVPSKELTAKQVDEALGLLEEIGRRITLTRPAVGAGGTIGSGAKTGSDQEINDYLERLRMPKLAPADEELVTKMLAVARALPRGGRTRVKMSVVGGLELFRGYWGGPMEVAQGGEVSDLLKGADIDCGKGAADVAIRVYRYPGRTGESRLITIPGPWSVIRLLHAGQRKDQANVHSWKAGRREADGAAWQVELTVDVNREGAASKRTVVLKLEFPKRFPRIEDWPTSP